MCVFNWLSGVRPGSSVPLSQAISDTGCITSGRNQLTAAGSCGESMILNRNQDKWNLTLSLAGPSYRGVLEGCWGAAAGGRTGKGRVRRGGEERGRRPSLPTSCRLPQVCGELPTRPPPPPGSWVPLGEEIQGLLRNSLAVTVTPPGSRPAGAPPRGLRNHRTWAPALARAGGRCPQAFMLTYCWSRGQRTQLRTRDGGEDTGWS